MGFWDEGVEPGEEKVNKKGVVRKKKGGWDLRCEVKVLRWSVEWRKVSQKKDVGLRFKMEKWAGKEWLEKLGIGFWIRIVYIRDVI